MSRRGRRVGRRGSGDGTGGGGRLPWGGCTRPRAAGRGTWCRDTGLGVRGTLGRRGVRKGKGDLWWDLGCRGLRRGFSGDWCFGDRVNVSCTPSVRFADGTVVEHRAGGPPRVTLKGSVTRSDGGSTLHVRDGPKGGGSTSRHYRRRQGRRTHVAVVAVGTVAVGRSSDVGLDSWSRPVGETCVRPSDREGQGPSRTRHLKI